MSDSPVSRWGLWTLFALGAGFILVSVGHWDHAGFSRIGRWTVAFLPWLTYLAILLFADWVGEGIRGSWGLWAARRDLRRLQRDLAVLETWRLGGRPGVWAFLFLFWTSLSALAAYGALFLCSGLLAVAEAVRPLSTETTALLPVSGGGVNDFLGSLTLLWLVYGIFLSLWRRYHPNPPIPEDGVPQVASLADWRKHRLIQTQEEASAFLSLFREACPEFSAPKGLPWKMLLVSLPEFSLHFFHWAGGHVAIPLAASAGIGLLGSVAVFLSLWRLVPWTCTQTKGLLRPERASPCSYQPMLQLRRLAQSRVS